MIREKVFNLRKKKKPSSNNWLLRHMNDPYVHLSQEKGYRCRSVFKLQEIHEKFGILKPGMAVLDLGCAPGGWSQWTLPLIGKRGFLMGVDLLEVKPLAGLNFVRGDVTDPEIQGEIEKRLQAREGDQGGAVASDKLSLEAFSSHDVVKSPLSLGRSQAPGLEPLESLDTATGTGPWKGRETPGMEMGIKPLSLDSGLQEEGKPFTRKEDEEGLPEGEEDPHGQIEKVFDRKEALKSFQHPPQKGGQRQSPGHKSGEVSSHGLFDVILSDMAPSLTGHAPTDRVQMDGLLAMVWEIAQRWLAPGGSLIVKVYHGDMMSVVGGHFSLKKYMKPLSSRRESREIYMIAKGFKGVSKNMKESSRSEDLSKSRPKPCPQRGGGASEYKGDKQ